MNLDEAVELLRVVSAIPVRKSAKHPEIRIVHAVGDIMAKGYTVRIDKNLTDADYRSRLARIVGSRDLEILDLERYLIVYRRSV